MWGAKGGGSRTLTAMNDWGFLLLLPPPLLLRKGNAKVVRRKKVHQMRETDLFPLLFRTRRTRRWRSVGRQRLVSPPLTVSLALMRWEVWVFFVTAPCKDVCVCSCRQTLLLLLLSLLPQSRGGGEAVSKQTTTEQSLRVWASLVACKCLKMAKRRRRNRPL